MQSKPVKIKRVSEADDLAALCEKLQPEMWGEDNDMGSYQPNSLMNFLHQNGSLLLAYSGDKIAGAALCYSLPHPSPTNSSLYVHELDTHPNFRRQGVGTMLMQEAFKLGKELGVNEVWLGTEHDNEPAKALYEKLKPTEIEHGPTYSYKIR